MAEKDMMAHLNDLEIPNHGLYNKEHLFPQGKLIWENNAYVCQLEDEDENKTEIESIFLEKLRDTTTDFNENHYVGTAKRLRRDGMGAYARGEEAKVGFIVVFSCVEGDLKWCVGEVMEVEDENGYLTVCEYGCTGNIKRTNTENIKWAARYRGVEMGLDHTEKGRKKKRRKK